MKDDDDQDGKDEETMTMITIMIMMMMKGAHLPNVPYFFSTSSPNLMLNCDCFMDSPPISYNFFFWRDCQAQTMFENAEFGQKNAI